MPQQTPARVEDHERLIRHIAARFWPALRSLPVFSWEDAMQEGRLACWQALCTYDGRARLSTWMGLLIEQRYMNLLRRQRPATLSLDAPLTNEPDDGRRLVDLLADDRAGPEEQVLDGLMSAAIGQAWERAVEAEARRRPLAPVRSVGALLARGEQVQRIAVRLSMSQAGVSRETARLLRRFLRELGRFFGPELARRELPSGRWPRQALRGELVAHLDAAMREKRA